MKNIILLLTILISEFIYPQNYKKVEIFFNSKKDLQMLSGQIDHFSKNSGNSVIAFLSDDELKQIQTYFQTKILIDDWYKYYNDIIIPQNIGFQKNQSLMRGKSVPKNFDYGSMGGFYTLQEVYARLDSMLKKFPNLISARKSIGVTNENRDIYYVKISDNPEVDEAEPEVLYTALHHAREPESMMQMIYFMWYLLENYNSNSEVKFLVDNREIYFIPVVNPDGYYYNQSIYPSGGGMWRKNRRANSDGSYGVDLNRNYGPFEYWNAPNGGSSLTPSSDTYRGTSPFSEPETQAIKNFLAEREIRNCLNYHTFSNLLIYPYGALNHETKDSLLFRDFAKDMTQFNNYVYGTDMQTVGYTTRGNSDDYFYDGDTATNGKIFAMTPEVGSSSDGFWPAQSRIIPLAEENLFPNIYWLWVAGGFVNVTNLNYSKNNFIQGDTIKISLKVKHKGLGKLGQFSVRFESPDEKLINLSDAVVIDSIGKSEEKSIDNIFSFYIYPDLINGTEVSFKIIISSFGFDISSQEYKITIGKPVYTFADTIDATGSHWNKNGWTVISDDSYSPKYSFTDSPSGFYPSNSYKELIIDKSINLFGIDNPVLSFHTKFDIENNWDYGQVLISSDSGITWQAVGGNLSNNSSGQFQPLNSLVYDGKLPAWTKEEIKLSEFAGKKILIKFILVSDEYIEFDGWYIDDIEVFYYPITSIDEDSVLPLNFSLSQNYPNPFNPTTSIKYSLPEQQFVSLKIFDILGREVATLVNENKPSGNYEVNFDAGNISSGVYFYQLRAESFTETKKMLLMK